MIKYFYLTHRWDPNMLGQSGSKSNNNEEVLHIPQSSKTGKRLMLKKIKSKF